MVSVTTLPEVSDTLVTVELVCAAVTTFCRVQSSTAEAPDVKYVPASSSNGELAFTPRFVAAVVLAHVQVTALVWSNVVENPALARVRLPAAFWI